MAYDPNCADTKAAVKAAVDAALAEAHEAHEQEIEGLKNKNSELLEKLRKARTNSGGDNTAEIERLETELSDSQSKLRAAENATRETTRRLKTAESERDAAVKARDSESKFSANMLIENGLTTALMGANVDPDLMEAAKALLGRTAAVKVEGDDRTVLIGDKPLSDFVSEWAKSEKAKPFIKAPVNTGAGASGTQGRTAGKLVKDMTEAERVEMARSNPEQFRQLCQSQGINLAA